jgi:hypothetical protein
MISSGSAMWSTMISVMVDVISTTATRQAAPSIAARDAIEGAAP